MMSIENRIKEKVRKNLSPIEMELRNVSQNHIGHEGHDGTNDTHFELYIVTDEFDGMSKITRQRRLYSLLEEEFKDGLHALSIKAFTKKEVGF